MLTIRPVYFQRFVYRLGSGLHRDICVHQRLGRYLFAMRHGIRADQQDLIVDWSLFRPQSGLLRHDRGYSSRYVRDQLFVEAAAKDKFRVDA